MESRKEKRLANFNGNEIDPRYIVALTNLLPIGIAAAILLACWKITGQWLLWPILLVSAWCIYIQFSVRKRNIHRNGVRIKWRLQEVVMGIYGPLVILSIVSIVPKYLI